MRRGHVIAGVLALVLSAGLAALLFPPLRQAVGIAGSNSELAASERLFKAALQGRPVETDGSGLAVRPAPTAWKGWRIGESEADCRGRGVYLIRTGPSRPLAITAPHRGSDRHTGTLAAQLFLESAAVAAAWNSAPRRPGPNCAHALDLAKAPQHPFTAFALAFARQYRDGRIVQLHGFERSRRTTGSVAEAAMVVSDGTTTPDGKLLDLADCLSVAFAPAPVLVFPHEARELGGLTNAQGKALRQSGFQGFVHLEMSAQLRERLADDRELRGSVLRCLLDRPGASG